MMELMVAVADPAVVDEHRGAQEAAAGVRRDQAASGWGEVMMNTTTKLARTQIVPVAMRRDAIVEEHPDVQAARAQADKLLARALRRATRLVERARWEAEIAMEERALGVTDAEAALLAN